MGNFCQFRRELFRQTLVCTEWCREHFFPLLRLKIEAILCGPLSL